MDQPDLFDRPQDAELIRVAGKIGPAVLSFCKRKGRGGTFHAQELHNYVGGSVAPASADRILRHLRRVGAVDYVIINRRASFYQITAVEDT